MSGMNLPKHFHLRTEYVWLTDGLKRDLDILAYKHITNRQDSYLKKYIDKDDAEVDFHLRVEKVKGERYECSLHATLDGEHFDWSTGEKPFVHPDDVVNHAFKHVKEYLAHK